jgi:protein O-GlcNAc transferase
MPDQPDVDDIGINLEIGDAHQNFRTDSLRYALSALQASNPQEAIRRTHLVETSGDASLDSAAILVAAHLRLGQISEAEFTLMKVPAPYQTGARFHRMSAAVFSSAGNTEMQVRALAAAANSLDADANDYSELGNLLVTLGLHERASVAYEKAYRTRGETQFAALTAASLLSQNRTKDAVEWYNKADTINGTTRHFIQHIEALHAVGEFEIAAGLLRKRPRERELRLSLARARFENAQALGDFGGVEVARQDINEFIETGEADEIEELSQVRLFLDHDSNSHARFYRRAESLWMTPSIRSTGSNSRDLAKLSPLRIGYLSADFREHVMGRMMDAIFSNRDKGNHATYLYSLSSSEDSLTRRLEEVADVFRRCANASDSALTSLIEADQLDILVDLSGPTAGCRPTVLANKPSPIIITHIGTGGPFGLSQVDYKLTDSICDLPQNQDYMIEKLLPMDGCCYPVPKYPLPTRGLTKSDLMLKDKTVIGAFYTYMKLSKRCVMLWKALLDEIPMGLLLFSPLDPKLKPAYENIMRAANISPGQYRFISTGPTESERLARYRVVDFVLDSMPYGGVNGTLEALFMGVPVVTLTGRHHVERTTTSMLTHLGVTDTIAATPDEYIAYAKRLAKDSAWRDDISTRIRARWPKFADPVDYARRWEALLRKVAK